MKNGFIIAGTAVGLYGLYLLFKKKDCGCKTPAASVSGAKIVKKQLYPDSARQAYDSSFRGVFPQYQNRELIINGDDVTARTVETIL
jgi:hypothetical protein